MKRRAMVIVGVLVVIGGVIALRDSDSGYEVECHPWRNDYLGRFEQREGPGAASSVVFGRDRIVNGAGRSTGVVYRADGAGTWRVTEDNLVEWTIDGLNVLDTGAQVPWQPSYVAVSVECDNRGRVTRITGNGTDTAPFPSHFDFIRVDDE